MTPPPLPRHLLERAREVLGAELREPAEERGVFQKLATVTLDAVQPEQVSWLWPGRIPRGKLTLLEGDPGTGKSLLTMRLAAAVTTGDALPGAERLAPRDALFVALEDGLADTLRPRAEAAGCDLHRVHAVQCAERLPTLPDDVAAIGEIVREHACGLIVIDPITAYMASATDGHRDQDVRRALLPLAQLAEEAGAAVVVVRHLPKTRSRNAVLAGAGSIAFAGLARTVLLLAPQPDDPARRVVAVAKSNLAEFPPSISFRIVADGPAGARVEWTGPSTLSANDLHAAHADAAGEDASLTDEAAAWLRDVLTGRDMPRAEVLKAARAEGFSEPTTRRAAKKAAVVMARRGFSGGSIWSLATAHTEAPFGSFGSPDPHSAHSNTVSRMGLNEPNEANSTVGTRPFAPVVRTGGGETPPLPDDTDPLALHYLTL